MTITDSSENRSRVSVKYNPPTQTE